MLSRDRGSRRKRRDSSFFHVLLIVGGSSLLNNPFESRRGREKEGLFYIRKGAMEVGHRTLQWR